MHETAPRVLGVLDPVKVVLKNFPTDPLVFTVPNFPFDPSRGTHELCMDGPTLFIDRQDFRMEDSEVCTHVPALLAVRS